MSGGEWYDLDKLLLRQWEQLWLDPDWDSVHGYRPEDAAPAGPQKKDPSAD